MQNEVPKCRTTKVAVGKGESGRIRSTFSTRRGYALCVRHGFGLAANVNDSNQLTRMLETGDHSDLVLRCTDGKIFNVHKAIVCAQSDFFSRACQSGRFKVSLDKQRP